MSLFVRPSTEPIGDTRKESRYAFIEACMVWWLFSFSLTRKYGLRCVPPHAKQSRILSKIKAVGGSYEREGKLNHALFHVSSRGSNPSADLALLPWTNGTFGKREDFWKGGKLTI
jgi:hypothetical protein